MTTPSPAGRVVDALVSAHLLDPADRAQSREVVSSVLGPAAGTAPAQGPARGTPRLVEVVAYLGGALVLAAGALFLVQQWADLGFASRVTLLTTVAAVLAVAGVLTLRVAAGPEAVDTRRRLGGALLIGAALAAAILVGHLTDEWVARDVGGVDWPAVTGASAGFVAAVASYRLARTALGLLAMLVAAVSVVANLGSGDVGLGSAGDTVGLAIFLVGVLWLAATEAGRFEERTIARALGVATVLVGAQIPVIDGTHAWLGYTLTLLVAVAGLAAYLDRVAWPYLAVGVLAVTLVVPEAVSDWTEGSLGAVGGVLVAGVTLLVASAAGYRVRAGTEG